MKEPLLFASLDSCSFAYSKAEKFSLRCFMVKITLENICKRLIFLKFKNIFTIQHRISCRKIYLKRNENVSLLSGLNTTSLFRMSIGGKNWGDQHLFNCTPETCGAHECIHTSTR